MTYKKINRSLGVAAGLLFSTLAAAETMQEDWNAKFQSTYVWQKSAAFHSPYASTNSLSADAHKSYSFTATAAFGIRLWQGSELYFNPEIAQGVAFSNLTGLGGFTNGELARTSGSDPTLYRARLFLRQTWGLGGGTEEIESDANQLAGIIDKHRVVLTAGNMSILDIFDDNTYNHDPRTQFMNWALMTHGAYDYAADSRGYSWGVVLEYFHDEWAVRAGRFIQPKEPNQLALDSKIFEHYGDQVEVEHAHEIFGQPGKLRLLGFRNHTKMSRYEDALELASQTSAVPDINLVRTSDQVKYGVGLNLEQAINADIGVFMRAMWADGRTETYAFTEVDRSLSGGALIKGNAWHRPEDTIGVAFAMNALSKAHQDYLAAGGLGFFLGDGHLNYSTENIIETFYNLKLTRYAWLSVDYQHIDNPGYNADRGPVNFGGLRLHTEF
jgi:high affinity Mn2+ porin